MRMTVLDRLILLLAVILAAYQIAFGIDGFEAVPLVSYTAAFGVLLVAGLLLILLGFDVLDSPLVVVVSTTIPLGLSLGLVWEHLPAVRAPFLAFVLAGFTVVLFTRLIPGMGKLQLEALTLVHGVAGLLILGLPLWLTLQGRVSNGFALVGLGGALIGFGGMLLSFLRAGRPKVPRPTVYKALPVLLLLTTASFVGGFACG